MPYIKLEAGTRFGRLTVLERGPTKPCKHITWKCRCDCGNLVDAVSQALRDGRTKSCGCLQREKAATLSARYTRLILGEASFNLVARNVVQAAHSRNLECSLTTDDIRSLITQPCIYCGRKETQTTHGKNMHGAFKHVGIDRVDNTQGYTRSNSVPCCADCNRAKGTLTLESFKAWVKRAHAHLTSNPL